MTVPISLELNCCPLAEQTFRPVYEQLSSGRYEWPCSVLPLSGDFEDYLAEHRTARKRAARCGRLGYVFQEIDRTQYERDVFAINTSAPERQGRPMSEGYREPVRFSPLPDFPCARHAIRTYGVLNARGRLVAYTWIYRAGELAMFSSILGHADHLAREVMYLLSVEALRDQWPLGGFAFYNRADSGTDGLRFFKDRIGFEATRVEWRP